MADQETPGTGDVPTADQGEGAEAPPAKKVAAKKTAAKKATTKKAAAKKTTAKKTTAKKSAADPAEGADPQVGPTDGAAPQAPGDAGGEPAVEAAQPAKKAAAKRASKRTTKKTATGPTTDADASAAETATDAGTTSAGVDEPDQAAPGAVAVPLFQPPEQVKPARKRAAKKTAATEDAAATAVGAETGDPEQADRPATDEDPPARSGRSGRGGAKRGPGKDGDEPAAARSEDGGADGRSAETADPDTSDSDEDSGEDSGEGGGRRRRRRGGRRRRKSGGDGDNGDAGEESGSSADEQDSGNDTEDDGQESSSSRRRRRRRREGDSSGGPGDDPENTVTRVRKTRSAEDEITAVTGSTRLEAKKQRRREGREAGRRRAPIVSEAEFLARRESVDRVMVIRQRDDLTQIGVLEDKVLVEHYVARESQTSLIGNVYLGRVQNVLPSMEAAFIDIGKGRNAVLYAGEVNWSALGHKDGAPRKIESVLTSGQSVLVQVTKDPVGHKGARLTSQVSLAGRFLVYVPDGTTSGISRKLPDTERSRLKALLKEIVPDTAGVIVRTAAEGASEEELTRDVERLKARWEDIESKSKGSAPKLLYGEPDLTLKVVRDLFTEDFSKLVIDGDDAWDTVHGYVTHVAPDLADRLERYQRPEGGPDVFAAHRIDEQIAKALDRKVWLPSGGSLVIDRTEAMTVVDVNTGKFTGSGGNLEETVTKNNLEAAEEVVRQLRLRDIGGIIVVDFIDMVLESNRDLVLRRLVECLGRDRTKHQVAEVTSLGLVQMTRKRIGTGLLEAFTETCEHCQGRGLKVHDMPIEPRRDDDDGRRGRRRGGRGKSGGDDQNGSPKPTPTPKDVAAMARADRAEEQSSEEQSSEEQASGTPRSGNGTAVTSADDAPTAPETPSEAAAEPARSRRRRSSSRSGVTTPTENRSGPDTAQESDPEQSDAPQPTVAAAAPAPETGTGTGEPAPTTTTTTATTTTRKRSARRPAGPPATASPAAAEPVAVEPVTVPPASSDPVTGPAPAAEKPTVVTRTRGRAASRPAGPPSGEQAAGSADATDADRGADPGAGSESDGDGSAPTVEHVPVKKKGARKR